MKRKFICLDDQSIKGTIFLVTVKTHWKEKAVVKINDIDKFFWI